jgi:uncharacterized membrane protein YphA (DoxX/SURF4 family)
MNKVILKESLIALLILLFVYTGVSKLIDIKAFKAGMKVQPFPVWFNATLTYSLPVIEVIVALALVFDRTRKHALRIYFLLMLCFTIYTGLITAGFFAHRPCGCGGIITGLNWTWHFIINTVFLLLTCVAIRLHSKRMILRNQGVSQKPVKE